MKYFILLFTITQLSFSQSINGTSGLINIPSARTVEDGILIIGASYIPKTYFQSTSGINQNLFINPGLNTYLTFGILPFVEIMFSYTHELSAKVNPTTRYFPDRRFTLRTKILKETHLFPSILVGFQDITSLFLGKGNGYNASSYIVGSKEIKLLNGELDISFGKDLDFIRSDSKRKAYNGFFYGFRYKVQNSNFINFMLEFDSKHLHAGLAIEPHNKISITTGLYDLKKIFLTFNYRIEN